MLKSKTLYAQIKSSLTIAVFPLITVLALTLLMLSTVADRENALYGFIRDNMASEVSRAMNKAFEANYSLASSGEIKAYAASDKQSFWREREIGALLTARSVMTGYVRGSYVLLTRYDRILSTFGNHGAAQFFRLYPDTDEGVFDALIVEESDNGMTIARGGAYYWMRVNAAGVTPPAYCVTVMDFKTLRDDLKTMLPREDDGFAILYRGEILVSTENGSEAAARVAGADEPASVRKSGLFRVYDTAISGDLSLILLRVAPSVWDTLGDNHAWSILIGCFLITLFLCFFISYRNAKPVRKIATMISANAPALAREDRAREDGEYGLIENSLKFYFGQVEQLTEKLARQNEAFRAVYLEKLLLGQIASLNSVSDMLRFFNIPFHGHENFVVIPEIDLSESEQMESDAAAPSESDVAEALYQSFKAACPPGGTVYRLEINHLGLFVCSVPDAGAYAEKLTQIAARTEQYAGCRIRLARSAPVDRGEKLSDAYREALGALGDAGDKPADRGASTAKYIETCIEYIHDVYADTSLSVEKIAAHCGLDSSYLARLFNSDTGIGLLEYLQRYRINRAKTLIAECPNTRINALCESVGYANVATFIRVFKKYEGTTPGQYRDILLQGDFPTHESKEDSF